MTRRAASWAEGEKSMIGTAVGEVSRVWFTLANGRLTEVFYPAPDRACIRALGFIAATDDWISDEEVDTTHHLTRLHDDVPLVTIDNRDRAERYRITKETFADPRANVVLQRVHWRGPPARLFCRLEPHVDNSGVANHAEVFDHRGTTILGAHRAGIAVALACARPWVRATALHGPAQLDAHHALAALHARAHGTVTLIGELAVADGDSFELALAFGHLPHEAAHLARAALARGYDASRAEYITEWKRWTRKLPHAPPTAGRWWAHSIAVLKTLEAKRVEGGRVAALSTPWGTARGPRALGTYHLVWTRDLVESMGGMLAAGVHHEARQAMTYLRATQHPDGHWPHNMYLDGMRVSRKPELDETALPILLVDLLRRERALSDRELEAAYAMVARAADHLAATGPSTALDRWEDTAGITPFTVATEVAALACAAALARQLGDPQAAERFRAVAEQWNADVETWLYRRGGRLADQVGVDGYYVRARLPGAPFAELDLDRLPATEVSPDALALVRFGLRDANDPRIANTVRVIDAVLAADLPAGPAWRRYPNDAYGEHADGAAFDGRGIGRPWPLLIGERAHYELARGNRERCIALLRVMEACASDSGMLPEQVWDAADLPERGLRRGRPTGSAAPLGWAHAEYVKLCRSLTDGRVFDLPSVRV